MPFCYLLTTDYVLNCFSIGTFFYKAIMRVSVPGLYIDLLVMYKLLSVKLGLYLSVI